MNESTEIYPLTADRWDDLAALFGPNGADGGCWDMYWRFSSTEYRAGKGELNREALKALASRDRAPGLLAYLDGQAVGWCSVGPRGDYGRLQHSRNIKPVDDKPAWCIVCFYIHRKYRGQKVATSLLQAAVQFAAEHGAQAVEGYPIKAEDGKVDGGAAFTGTYDMFIAAGFREMAVTESKSGGNPRVIMRRDVGSK